MFGDGPVRENTIPWRDAPEVAIDRDGPETPFRPFDPVTGPETPILDLISARANAAPDHIAVHDGVRSLTYRALLDEAAALAAAIAGAADVGQPVGIRLPDTASGPVALLACLAAGTPAVLLDSADPPDRLARLAAASRLAAIITLEDLPGHRCLHPRPPPASVAFDRRPLAQGDPAFVVWTSGSTGQPKGIVHSQRSVLHRAGLLLNSGHLGPADRYLSLNTPASMGALLNAVAAWLAGATLHRVSLTTGGLGGVLRRIHEDRITAVIGVPAIYRALSRLGAAPAALGSLRLLSSNGEALLTADLGLLRACLPPGCHIQMVYGATETQAAMRFVPGDETPAGAQVAAGRPIPGTRFAILGAEREGELGELLIRSRYTAIGEWQDGRCVPGRLIPDGEPGWRRYAMGDLVRLGEDGAFVVAGRADRQVKINGYRVEPVEVEAILRGDDAVLDAAVLPALGPLGVELVAFVAVGAEGGDALRQRLIRLLAAHVPATMRPRRLHLLHALPLLPGAKIDAEALRRLDAAPAAPR